MVSSPLLTSHHLIHIFQSAVFDDLAHQIVHQTTSSLHSAALLISSKSSPTDSQLFLVKHLLILKQQIVAFDIEFVATIPDVSFDFSGVTQTFYELRERGGLFNPRNLMRLVGGSLFPRVVENMLDAKAELDGRLRTVINDFTNTFAKRMTTSLPSTAPSDKKTSPDAGKAVLATRKSIEQSVPFLRRKLDEYISDHRTKETLVAAVQDQVVQVYEDFFDIYTSKENNKGKTISRKGKGREDAVWDVDTFAEWTEGIFGVGIEVDGDGDGEGSPGRSRSLSRSGGPTIR
jgi:conserved oligomeric Golgi complex subunit 3